MKARSAIQRRRPKVAKAGARSEQSAERYLSKAIGRALDVLDLFPDEHCRLNLKEIGTRMKLPESSLFRVLVTLENRSYLIQDTSGCYRLAPKVLFGKLREHAKRVTELAHPTLRRLASQFNETASMAYLFETRIQVLDSVDTLHEVRVINAPGRVLPPHCSSLGKAITAFQEPALVDEILGVYGLVRRTPYTLVDRQALLENFEEIRENGYAVDREEASEGGICMAAPIRCEGKRVIAALSLSVPKARMNPGREHEIIRGVLDAAARVAKLI